MKNYSSYPDTRRPDDRELADVLTAISVVSRRLARKLTAASYQSTTRQMPPSTPTRTSLSPAGASGTLPRLLK